MYKNEIGVGDIWKEGDIVRLTEVEKLLKENNIPFTLTVKSYQEYWRKKGIEEKEKRTFSLLTIPNPNHEKNIEIVFADASENPKFIDLEFGGVGYEMFQWEEEDLPRDLLNEIKDIRSGKEWIVCAANAKTGVWLSDHLFCDGDENDEDDWNNMDDLYKTISKIRKPKSLWSKITGRTRCYEIFNWNSYEKIVK